jgi:cellulose synthase/poly-beta-1,6-N-acetylglucosamine synthase-like glycosyltransferase
MTALEYLLISPVILILFFQIFYLVESFRVCIEPIAGGQPLLKNPQEEPQKLGEKISIIIPVYGTESTIFSCLESTLGNFLGLVDKVVVVLDRCQETTKNKICAFIPQFALQSVKLEVIDLPSHRSGKVQALLHGGNYISTSSVLLLDSDIILEKTAIERLLRFHLENNNSFSSCLIYPYLAMGENPSTAQQIVCNNRLYRQSIVQLVKNLHGVANFPGGLQLVDFAAYRNLLVDGFLEDLTATYKVLSSGKRVAILPQVLAYEVERQTLLGLFLQRVRWTIGAIQHLPVQFSTAFACKGSAKKILISSYHVMWEFQHYVIVLSLVAIPFSHTLLPLFCMPLLLYFAKIIRMLTLTRSYYKNSWYAAVLHCLVHPCIITAALPCSLVYLLRKRSFTFEATALFRRI